MRDGRPSFTAAFVAFARGMAGVDEIAEKLVTPGFSPGLRFDAKLPRWTIAATYATPEGSALGPRAMGVALAGFGAIGEPIHGLMTPEEVAAALEGVGFEVLEDTGVEEWGALASWATVGT